MRIGIYIDSVKDLQPRGVGLHVLNLVRQIAELDRQNDYYLYYQHALATRTRPLEHLPKSDNFHYRPVRFPEQWIGQHPRLWWDMWLPRKVRRDQLDVFHCPNHFLPGKCSATSIMTIHDIAYFKMDHLYSHDMTNSLREWTKKSLKRATRVIALSQNTATDLECLGVDSNRIRVIYGGGNVVPQHQIRVEHANSVRERYRLQDRFILYVGTLHPRKNVGFLLRAVAELKRSGRLRHQIVLVGRPEPGGAEVIQTINALGLESDVTITGYVESWEIPLFYKMADVFVLPTLYEGFTLVTLEAMHYGVPVISTDTSSIREGVGDAGLLVPVNDVPMLCQALEKVLSDQSFRTEMIRRGKNQSLKFTWEGCAQQTIALYHELAGTETTKDFATLYA